MSFSADKVNILKGAFSHRRFSSSKDPSESGMFQVPSFCFLRPEGLSYVMQRELRIPLRLNKGFNVAFVGSGKSLILKFGVSQELLENLRPFKLEILAFSDLHLPYTASSKPPAFKLPAADTKPNIYITQSQ